MRRGLLIFFIATGVLTFLVYLSWWMEQERYLNPVLLLLLLGMGLYVTAQVFFVWSIYLHAGAQRIPDAPATRAYTVDVFLPTYNEPIELIERTLRAVLAIHHPHTTYIIDDGADDRVRSLANAHGAKYIRRNDTQDHKAGNINNAIQHSSGELVVIFDIDHIPQPGFLDHVIPFFDDPEIGVVQVSLDHYNTNENFIAAASGRMSDEFFAATMNGMSRMGCAVVFGSNAIFRRSALLSLGGYRPGLAEDLNTSIHLHANGWKSAYLPLVVAKGLVPADLDAFFKQQFKWARGVFDVLFNVMPGLAGKLTLHQRICYTTRMTYYLAGPIIAFHIALAIAAPFLGFSMESVGEYIRRGTPFIINYVIVHIAAYDAFALKPVKVQVELRGVFLALSSWPVYTIAFFSSLFRRKAAFVSTPKSIGQKPKVLLVVPQVLTAIALFAALIYHFQTADTPSWPYVILVTILMTVQMEFLPAAFVVRNNSKQSQEPR
jgi:cellulose synthase (UDP-forming)